MPFIAFVSQRKRVYKADYALEFKDHARIAFVDKLRGIAIFLVLFQHATEQIVLKTNDQLISNFLENLVGNYINFGRMGVVLFFFISGYVIPFSFSGPEGTIRSFVISRVFRLYPTYWLSILCGIGTSIAIDSPMPDRTVVLVNLTMFQAFFGVQSLRIAYWTLTVELVFYILCIALKFFDILDKRYVAFMCLSAIAVLDGILMYNSNSLGPKLALFSLNLMAMFIGMQIRRNHYEGSSAKKQIILATTAFIVVACFASVRAYPNPYESHSFFSKFSILSAYIFALAVFIASVSNYNSKILSTMLMFIGRISYSIYLMHAYVLSMLVYYLHDLSDWAAISVFALSFLFTSVVLSYTVYRFIELPGISLGKKLRCLVAHAALEHGGTDEKQRRAR